MLVWQAYGLSQQAIVSGWGFDSNSDLKSYSDSNCGFLQGFMQSAELQPLG